MLYAPCIYFMTILEILYVLYLGKYFVSRKIEQHDKHGILKSSKGKGLHFFVGLLKYCFDWLFERFRLMFVKVELSHALLV